MLERVFDPFFSTKFTGRGLGLAVARGVAHSHRGCMCISSTPAGGTSVRVLFPCSTAVEEVPVDEEIMIPSGWRGEGAVLLVDDEDSVLQVASEVLRRTGFEVFATNESQKVLPLFEEHMDKVSLALLDVTMPNYDVGETVAELRRRNPKLKILLSSGYSSETERIRRLLSSPLTRFLHKPYRAEQLIESVYRLVGHERAPSSVQEKLASVQEKLASAQV